MPLDSQLFRYQRGVLSARKASALYTHLKNTLPWQQPRIKVYGKAHLIPRVQCYMGDSHTAYQYSNQIFTPEPWDSALDAMRQRLSRQLNVPFNAVLVNYYRHGLDCMGWHSDDEAELGAEPCIASVSLGALRTFKLRHKVSKEVSSIALESGSLLIMQGQSQVLYEHSLPKTTKVSQGRINLTFRAIKSSLL